MWVCFMPHYKIISFFFLYAGSNSSSKYTIYDNPRYTFAFLHIIYCLEPQAVKVQYAEQVFSRFIGFFFPSTLCSRSNKHSTTNHHDTHTFPRLPHPSKFQFPFEEG